MESIKGRFADLTVEVMRKLKTMKIDADDFRLYLISRLKCDNFILSMSSLSEMIEYGTRKRLWDYYNYSALEGIIKYFGKDDSEMIGKMEEYKTRLFAFKAKTKIADYVKYCTDYEVDAFEDYKKLNDREFYQLSIKLWDSKKNGSTIKVDENCLSYIDELWTSISNHFLLPPLSVLLEKIHSGCIEITWIIPEIIALTINSKATSPESIEFYQQKNIMHIMMNDKTVFNDDDVDLTEVCVCLIYTL